MKFAGATGASVFVSTNGPTGELPTAIIVERMLFGREESVVGNTFAGLCSVVNR